ncbi:MAG: RelA/SpoT domain-containing protein [Planctomycetaceae bacterium]|jgi:ppGpp synthetase/RelA/SpoT-type nucleotidyltranferase|nr:RelA/SpoT domain-containing protein [Planctomycetaceae bacterium]
MNCQYTTSEIDRAGDLLMQCPQDEGALLVLNYWRAFHARFLHDVVMPCNFIDCTNEREDFSVSTSARSKRAVSIIDKLRRFPRLKLSQIQDIIGIRYVLTPTSLRASDRNWFTDFVEWQKEYLSNCFTIKRVSDYINCPRETGYRAVHFVLEYRDLERQEFDCLQFELQIRTRYQHLWAMAVETVDMVYGKSLKTSKENDLEGWSNFFRCASALISCREDMPVVGIYAQKDEAAIRDELLKLGQEKTFFTKLAAISQATKSQLLESYDYWFLEIDIRNHESRVLGFKDDALRNAIALYEAREQNPDCMRGDVNVVLVSAQGFRDIREAYPSYFLDIEDFVSLIRS